MCSGRGGFKLGDEVEQCLGNARSTVSRGNEVVVTRSSALGRCAMRFFRGDGGGAWPSVPIKAGGS